jgi:hypothetical protein
MIVKSLMVLLSCSVLTLGCLGDGEDPPAEPAKGAATTEVEQSLRVGRFEMPPVSAAGTVSIAPVVRRAADELPSLVEDTKAVFDADAFQASRQVRINLGLEVAK